MVLGGFLMLTTNMERLFARWQQAAEFSVYLADATTVPQRAALEKSLRSSSLVSDIDIVTKDEAMRRFRMNFAALADVGSADHVGWSGEITKVAKRYNFQA